MMKSKAQELGEKWCAEIRATWVGMNDVQMQNYNAIKSIPYDTPEGKMAIFSITKKVRMDDDIFRIMLDNCKLVMPNVQADLRVLLLARQFIGDVKHTSVLTAILASVVDYETWELTMEGWENAVGHFVPDTAMLDRWLQDGQKVVNSVAGYKVIILG